MTTRMEAIAFRIWQVAEPKGWDLTVTEAAEMVGVSRQAAIYAVRAKGWRTRFRGTVSSYDYFPMRKGNGGQIGIYAGFEQ